MTFLNTSLTRKLIIFSAGITLSLSSFSADFKDIDHLKRLANQGDAEAQAHMGLMYQNGVGVRQDYTKAFDWYQKSANQGNQFSQHNLGILYYNGQGVRQNTATAKEWFGKSCDNGYQGGCDKYRALNRK